MRVESWNIHSTVHTVFFPLGQLASMVAEPDTNPPFITVRSVFLLPSQTSGGSNDSDTSHCEVLVRRWAHVSIVAGIRGGPETVNLHLFSCLFQAALDACQKIKVMIYACRCCQF